MEFDGQQLTTNLPEGVGTIFQNERGNNTFLNPGLNNYLLPSSMDSLPIGSWMVQTDGTAGGGSAAQRQIDVIEGPAGKAIAASSLRSEWRLDPLPETVKKAAQKLGVNIKLINKGHLKKEDYLRAFKTRTYPVATGDEGFMVTISATITSQLWCLAESR